jgi:uncharacterized protein (DUF362 family)
MSNGLLQVSPMVTHPELVKAVWTVVDEDGSVKDSAVGLCFCL